MRARLLCEHARDARAHELTLDRVEQRSAARCPLHEAHDAGAKVERARHQAALTVVGVSLGSSHAETGMPVMASSWTASARLGFRRPLRMCEMQEADLPVAAASCATVWRPLAIQIRRDVCAWSIGWYDASSMAWRQWGYPMHGRHSRAMIGAR